MCKCISAASAEKFAKKEVKHGMNLAKEVSINHFATYKQNPLIKEYNVAEESLNISIL